MSHTHNLFDDCATKLSLDALNHNERHAPARIGIDGSYLLDTAREWLRRNDPYWFLCSVIPPSLGIFLKEFLAPFLAKNLKVTVVFDGLPTALQRVEEPEPIHQPAKFWHNATNTNMEKQTKDIKEYLNDQQENEKFDEEVVPWITRYLVKLSEDKITVFTAPYLCWAQLAAFMAPESRYISDVVGSFELLGFEYVDRVILNVEKDGMASIVSKSDVERKVRIKLDLQQQDIPDMALRTAVILSQSSLFIKEKQLRWPRGMMAKTTLNIETWGSSQPFTDSVRKYFENCPVMTSTGECKPLCKLANRPTLAELRDLFHNNLQSDFPLYYYCLFSNVISPGTLSVLATGKIVDQAPLVDTKEYRTTLEYIIPLRTQIVFQLIVDSHHTTYFKRFFELQWFRTFISNNSSTPILRPPEIKLDEWEDLSDENHTFLSVLRYDQKAKQNAKYTGVKGSLGAVFLKSLDLLGYFTHAARSDNAEVSSASVYANALNECSLGGFCKNFSADDPSIPEAAVLLIELIRTKALTDDPLNTASASEQEYRRVFPHQYSLGVRMACRILTLVPLAVEGQWTGPINAEINGFTAIGRAFQRSLRSLTEVVATMLWVGGSNKFNLYEFKSMVTSLPFTEPISCYGGLIADFAFSNPEYLRAQGAKEKLDVLHKEFPSCVSLEKDIRRMLIFWDCAEAIACKLLAEEDQDQRLWSDNFKLQLDAATACVTKAFGDFR